MSDHIPFEIQEDIVKRLPIRSLIQFRSVSNAWKSLIDSSEFVTNYHHSQTHHYVSIVNDGTLPPLPLSVTLLKYPIIVGSSQGLVCFSGTDASDSRTKIAVIWNPTIRKSVTVSVPSILDKPRTTVIGFGVTPDTFDPKLIKVSFDGYDDGEEYVEGEVFEVFTLSTQSWKRLTTSLPHNSIAFEDNQVVIDRFIYWRTYDLRHEDQRLVYHGFEEIMSFDMITEEFKQLDLPDSFEFGDHLFISKVRESLVVVQMKVYLCDGIEAVSVWMMEHGDPKSLANKFTIKKPYNIEEVCGLRKSGELLIEMIEDNVEHELDDLFVSRFDSQITAMAYSCNVNSCIETLLLLDH